MAGGLGRRIGGYKPLQLLQGRPLLYWALKPYLALNLDILISVKDQFQKSSLINSLQNSNLNTSKINFIEDPLEISGQGPLCGIFQAMKMLPSGTLLVVSAVDQPLVNPQLLSELLSVGAFFVSLAVVCERDHTLEPFPGIYSSALMSELEDYLTNFSKRSLRGFLSYLSANKLLVTFRRWSKIDPKGQSFYNINTPEDLTNLERCFPQKNL